MKTQQYLEQIRRYDWQLSNKSKELEQLKQFAVGLKSPTYDDIKIQSSGDKDKIGENVAEIVDLEKEVRGIFEKRKVIVDEIEGMENAEQYHVLFSHYVLHKDLVEVAEEMAFSYRQITRIHSIAISAFEKKYGSRYKNNKPR